MEIIDLTHFIEEGMPVYPGDLPPSIKPVANLDVEGFSEKELLITTHTGTHIDAPAHLLDRGLALDNFLPDKFIGEACVINCHQVNPITPHHINKQLPAKTPEFILIHTGWDIHWGTETYHHNIPVMDEEAAELLSNLPIKGIGIDAPSFDQIGSEELANHRYFLSRNILLIENLTRLHKLIARHFIFSCFPLKIKNADGSPVRAMAIIQDH